MRKIRLKLTIGWTDATIIHDIEGKSYTTDSLCSILNKYLGMPSVWKKIKEDLYKQEGRKCWICGIKDTRLNAHEFWRYYPIRRRMLRDFKGKIINATKRERGRKKLIAIHHLCLACHGIQHFDTIFLSKEEGRWKTKLLKLCAKRTPKGLKNGIEEFLKDEMWKGERDNITKERIRDVKEYLNIICPRRYEIQAEINRRRKATEELIKHFCKVNHCSKKIFEKHWKAVQEKKRKTQTYKGILHEGSMEPDYGKYKNILLSCYEEYWKKQKELKKGRKK